MFEVDQNTESDALDEVRTELAKLSKPKTNWTQGLLVLAASVLLFSAAGSLGVPTDAPRVRLWLRSFLKDVSVS